MFKVGDKVYNYQYGWGIVKEELTRYIMVVFDNCKSVSIPFYKDGKETPRSEHPTLSFTEYTLQGFSQERPNELPEVGELCLVSDEEDRTWILKEFICYKPESTTPYITKGGIPYKLMKRIKILD